VFLSYSDQDEGWVIDVLLPPLQAAALRVLTDPRDLPEALGKPWLDVVGLAVDSSRFTLVVLTPEWLAGPWQDFEGLLAGHASVTARQRRLLPLLLKPTPLPRHIAYLAYADFTKPADQAEEMQRLLRNLATVPPEPVLSPVLNEHNTKVARDGLAALRDLMREPSGAVAKAVADYRDTFNDTRTQIDLLGRYKELHSQLHSLQVDCYNLVLQEIKRFPRERPSWDALGDYHLTLEEIIGRLRELGEDLSFSAAEKGWLGSLVESLVEGWTVLGEAIKGEDPLQLPRAAWSINRVLSRQPSYISASLTRMARQLKLGELEQALTTVRGQLDPGLNLQKVRQFAEGIDALGRLNLELRDLIDNHDRWQAFDTELRRIEENLEKDLRQELEWSWPGLSQDGQRLYGTSTEPWAVALQGEAARLAAGIAAGNTDRMRQAFRTYRGRALQRFFRLDEDLLKRCDKLKTVGSTLDSILGML
jgi:hypothetical protein